MLKLIIAVLGRGIKAGYKLDGRIKQEFNDLGENYSVNMQVAKTNICLGFVLQNGKINTFKKKCDCDLVIEIKNKKIAKQVFFGKISIKEAFCRHYFIVKGDIAKALGVVRILEKVENYLFPKFITKKLFNEKIAKEKSSLRFYLKTFLGV